MLLAFGKFENMNGVLLHHNFRYLLLVCTLVLFANFLVEQRSLNLLWSNLSAINSIRAAYASTPISINEALADTLFFYQKTSEEFKSENDYRNIARAFFRGGQYKESLTILEKAAILFASRTVYYEMGQVYASLGNTHQALAAWKKANASSHFLYLGNRADDHIQRKNFYEIAISISLSSPEPYYVYGDYLYYETLERARAIELYKIATAFDFNLSIRRQIAYARIAAYESDWVMAVSNYEEAISLGDNSTNTYLEYGDVLQNVHTDFGRIRSIYQQAHSLDQLNKWPYLRMTDLYTKNNQRFELIKWYKIALNDLIATLPQSQNEINYLLIDLIKQHAKMGICDVYAYLIQFKSKLTVNTALDEEIVQGCEE